MQHSITLFGKVGCPNCDSARADLLAAGMGFQYLLLDRDYTRSQLLDLTHLRQLPIVQIDGKIKGGYPELKRWLREVRDAN